MSISRKIYLGLGLIILPLIIAGGAYYWTNPKAPVYRAKAVYTVVPKTALADGNYQDMQATSLFMDVIKSWLDSDNLQSEIETLLPVANFTDLRTLSMQTFEISVTSLDKQAAVQGISSLREIIYREVNRYTKTDAAGGFVIYNFDPTVGQVFPKAWSNAGLGLLVGLALGGFMFLLDKYYFRK